MHRGECWTQGKAPFARTSSCWHLVLNTLSQWNVLGWQHVRVPLGGGDNKAFAPLVGIQPAVLPLHQTRSNSPGRTGFRRPTGHPNGPAAYGLPPMLGPKVVSKSSAPNYSIFGRSTIGSFYEDLSKTPGPCNYRLVDPSTYKTRPPHYSMLARNMPPGDNTVKPGPGAYSPEKYIQHRGLTFGIRHSDYVAPLIEAEAE